MLEPEGALVGTELFSTPCQVFEIFVLLPPPLLLGNHPRMPWIRSPRRTPAVLLCLPRQIARVNRTARQLLTRAPSQPQVHIAAHEDECLKQRRLVKFG